MIYAVLIISIPFFPVYLYALEYTLVEMGVLFSLAALAEVIFTYVAGKLLDRIPCNYGLAFIDFFGAIASIVYGCAQSYYHILAGKLLERAGNVFTPSYTVYENEAYKEDYETIYQYHLMTPEVIQLVAFPVLGYLLTYVFTSIKAYRLFFIILGLTNFLVIIYILKGLPTVKPAVSVEQQYQLSVPTGLYAVVAAETILVFGRAVGSGFVLVYYILDNLKGTFFTVTAVEAVVSLAIITTIIFTLRRKPDMVKAAQYGIVLMIVYAALMSWAPVVWVIFLAYFLNSVGHSLWFPRHRTLLMNLIPEEKRGEILGTISSLKKVVYIIGPIFAAFIAVKVYILAPFVVQLGTLVAVFFIYQWIGKR
jgi:MFS family permease